MPEKTKVEDINIQINEDSDKCCLCIPIKTGVTLIGIFILINALRVIYAMYWGIFNGVVVYASVLGVLAAPVVYSGYLFFKWFRKDCQDTRADLPKACVFIVFSSVASAVWLCVYWMAIYRYSVPSVVYT